MQLDPAAIAHFKQHVKHVILVLSGKGGVGKSTVACQLAMSLAARHGHRVGILDVDICGPSVPKICGAERGGVTKNGELLVPVRVIPSQEEDRPADTSSPAGATSIANASASASGSLCVMSIAYLLPNATDAVVWRGPRKAMMIRQFVTGVDWGDLDFLIVDTPPGTSDEHMTMCELLAPVNPTGAVVVTTPQNVSVDDVRKELSFCHKMHLRCLGIVENMSGFVCPHCAECTNIFSSGGGKKLAEMYEVPFLGAVPIDPSLCLAEDEGRRAFSEGATGAALAISAVIAAIKEQVARVDALSTAAPAE